MLRGGVFAIGVDAKSLMDSKRDGTNPWRAIKYDASFAAAEGGNLARFLLRIWDLLVASLSFPGVTLI